MEQNNADSDGLVRMLGHKRELSEGRSVVVAWRKDRANDNTYFVFVNAEGKKTMVKLSADATEALRELLSLPRDPRPYWTVVDAAAAALGE